MAKDKKTNFSSLGIVKKPKKIDPDEMIKKIHGEKIKRTTVDMPADLHKKIKMYCYTEDITVKEFFLTLAKEKLASL